MFSAGFPLGDRVLGVDVPVTFEELSVGNLIHDQPRAPGCLCSDTVRAVGAGLGATLPTASPLEYGSFVSSYELTGKRGAALATRYPTYKEDAILGGLFEEYTKQHFESWVAFARYLNYGDDVRPILVSGVDMTKGFAMAAYSYEDHSWESNGTSVPMFPSAPALWGTWLARGPPHTNCGPQECIPPEQSMTYTPSPWEGAETPSAFNQCVFIRYYTMRRGPLKLFPKVIKVG